MDLIQPLFVNQKGKTETAGLGADNSSWPESLIEDRIQKDIDKGVDSFLLFITPEHKSWTPDWSFNQKIVDKIKTKFPNIQLIVDVCLCSTLPDGHCRVMDKPDTSEALLIDLGKKLESAGADILAPSDMGEHTVQNLKSETHSEVMAYVKYRSVFYSSFRDLADSTPTTSRTYQLPVDNDWGMIVTANQYKKQKADYLLLKPAQHSLSNLSMIKSGTYTPVGVYQVSDEYKGLPTLQHQIEISKVYKSAGAKFLVTYGARDLIGQLD
jgi:porphobilinogen synthase